MRAILLNQMRREKNFSVMGFDERLAAVRVNNSDECVKRGRGEVNL